MPRPFHGAPGHEHNARVSVSGQCRDIPERFVRQHDLHEKARELSEEENQKLASRLDAELAQLQDRLTIHEYCCFMVRKLAANLDAFARAKAAPKTKSQELGYGRAVDLYSFGVVFYMLVTGGEADTDDDTKKECRYPPVDHIRYYIN